MCRLLGVVSSETTEFRFSLRDAPRSLAKLSAEHPHGWGLAVHCQNLGWTLEKHPEQAGADQRFDEVAHTVRGEVLLAHVRKRTVGPIGVANTHPFRRGDWVFAHNGTISDDHWLDSGVTPARKAEIEGQTDSERYFAKVLSRLDAETHVDAALLSLTSEIGPHLGAANFLLSNGRSLWAFRMGRTLHVLERLRGDPVRRERVSYETDARLETPWSPRRHAFLVASEAMTDEPWREVPEHSLLRIDSGSPAITFLR
ncbi:MAG: class II glutamine amidotransferase [Polyangiales bacterium]